MLVNESSEDFDTALMTSTPPDVYERLHRPDPHEDQFGEEGSSIASSILNCANTIVGSGTLALPFAIMSSGLVVGNAVMIVLVFITAYSLGLLVQAGQAVDGKCSLTYEGLGLYLMGKPGFLLAQLAFLFGGTGLIMLYLIFLGQLVPSIYTGKDSTDLQRNLTILAVIILVLPICFLRRLDKLKFVSTLSVISVSYLAGFIGVVSITKVFRDEAINSTVSWYHHGDGIFTTFSMLNSAFSCHISCLPLYKELHNRNLPRMRTVFRGGIIVALVVYEVVALPSYLHFGNELQENILSTYVDYYGHNVFLKIANAAFSITLFGSLPIILWPFRSCVISLYNFCREENVYAEPDACTWYICTTVCLLFCGLLAVLVPSVKIAFSIVGCIGGALIVYILPALFYINTREKKTFTHNPGATLLALVGGLACGVSLFVQLKSIFTS